MIKESDDGIQLAFSVKDSGIGIPPEKLERLFNAFSQVDGSTTRDFGGTGLGLVISQRLIKLMGGNISVLSKAGEGTTFNFDVFLERTFAGSAIEMSGCDCTGKRVLILDNNLTSRLTLQKQLAAWKLLPVVRPAPASALQLLEDGNVYDLIISDAGMSGKDESDFAKRLVELGYDIPVILLSTTAKELKANSGNLFHEVLAKPIKRRLLKEAICSALSKTEHHPRKQPAKEAPNLTEEFARQYPLRILVAEDNLINQKLIIKILSKLGYVADLAVNGQEAIDMFATGFYDVILMDVQMPILDGMEATKVIRQEFAEQPAIVALTANAMREDRELCLSAGMNEYLTKPVDIESLKVILSHINHERY